jgi:hypothetical protein
MMIALAGIFGWLLVVTTALCIGAAAKLGDELNKTVSQPQPCRAPIQCKTSCTISSSSR